MRRSAAKAWTSPRLESIDISSTAFKSVLGQSESGKNTCGPAQGGGAADNCS